jgi:hypothetical protein
VKSFLFCARSIQRLAHCYWCILSRAHDK